MRRDRRGSRGDEGSIMVLALVVSLLLAASASVAMSATVNDLAFSNQTSASTQAALASQSGLAAELAAMRSVTAWANLPCSLTGSLDAPGASSSYSVAVSYAASGTPLSCTGGSSTLGGTTPPTTATLLATGGAPRGASTVMREDVNIATSTQFLQALGYAIFTENNLDLTNAAVLDASGANLPNVYVGQTLTCNNGTISQGSVTTYAPITLANGCTFQGSLQSSGAVTLENDSSIGGSLTSYGGGIAMSGSAHIGGDATAAGNEPSGQENIVLSGTATIGSLSNPATVDADGSITLAPGTRIYGSEAEGDSTLATETMPQPVAFPTIPDESTWPTSTWSLKPISTSECTSYFSGTGPGTFAGDIDSTGEELAIDAPTCQVTLAHDQTYTLARDVALEVQSFTTKNTISFTSASSASPCNFSILAGLGSMSSTDTVDVNLGNSTTFDPSVAVFIYTPGQVEYANAQGMSGQVIAAGGVTGENAFTLTFNPSAAEELPDTSTPLPPTFAPTDKYVVKGL